MINVVQNLALVKERIARAAAAAGKAPQDITLVAVSKLASAEAVQALAAAGHGDFGENRVQEGRKKLAAVTADDVRWHLIGRLQTNKIKYLSPFFLIQSLDRWELAEKMSSYALNKGLIFNALSRSMWQRILPKQGYYCRRSMILSRGRGFGGITLRGLMTITALDATAQQTRQWFDILAGKFAALSQKPLPENTEMRWLSMGMSGDFELAIAAGANMVRVGSAIFAGEDGQYA